MGRRSSKKAKHKGTESKPATQQQRTKKAVLRTHRVFDSASGGSCSSDDERAMQDYLQGCSSSDGDAPTYVLNTAPLVRSADPLEDLRRKILQASTVDEADNSDDCHPPTAQTQANADPLRHRNKKDELNYAELCGVAATISSFVADTSAEVLDLEPMTALARAQVIHLSKLFKLSCSVISEGNLRYCRLRPTTKNRFVPNKLQLARELRAFCSLAELDDFGPAREALTLPRPKSSRQRKGILAGKYSVPVPFLTAEAASEFESQCESSEAEESHLAYPPLNVAEIGEFEAHTTGFGSRMLSLMGYTPGEGVGKHLDGIAVPIQVRKRAKRLGLGAS